MPKAGRSGTGAAGGGGTPVTFTGSVYDADVQGMTMQGLSTAIVRSAVDRYRMRAAGAEERHLIENERYMNAAIRELSKRNLENANLARPGDTLQVRRPSGWPVGPETDRLARQTPVFNRSYTILGKPINQRTRAALRVRSPGGAELTFSTNDMAKVGIQMVVTRNGGFLTRA